MIFARGSEGYEVSLRYIDASDINAVYVVEHLLCDEKTTEREDKPREKMRYFCGWLMRKSGVTFCWGTSSHLSLNTGG
jgi:hypothetical protein